MYYVQTEKEVILNSSAAIDNINAYKQFRETYPNNTFKGIIYDIDLQAFPDYEERMDEYRSAYLTFIYDVITNNTDIQFDFTITQQLYEEIEFKGETKPLYQFIFDFAYRVFVKSHAVTYDAIVDQLVSELIYANDTNKNVVITLNTEKEANSSTTFYGQGQHELHVEMWYFADVLNYNYISNYGISIVHMKSWYDLDY